MNTVQAMNTVQGFLSAGDVASAQAAVCEMSSVLPSSLFERVLRAAVETDSLLPFYRELCESYFGRQTFADMVG